MVDNATTFTIPCCVRGYHVYQHMWTPLVGEISATVRDPDNARSLRRILTFTFTLHTVLPLHSVEYHV